MRILVVDDQADFADGLAQQLQAATGYEVAAAVGSQQALAWVEKSGPPEVLISEVVLEGVDGFRLSESLREQRPELRTIYVTAYDLSEYQDYLNGTPVFYKPVSAEEIVPALVPHGDDQRAPEDDRADAEASPQDQRTRSARLRTLVDKQGFTGKLDQFDLVDIIQMCCVGKRTGRLQIARRVERGVLYLRAGQIVHAVAGQKEGEEAAHEIIGWSAGQFSFEDGVQPENQTIHAGWEHLVMDGMRLRDERASTERATDPDDVDPLLSGQTIGPYELKRKIGQGMQTQVFQAVQTSMNRIVVLKILLPELQHDEASVQNFLARASAKANVQHPSILSVYEAGESDGIYYYTREFVDGSTLGYLHAQGKTIEDNVAVQCIKIAAEALSYLNQQKIPHPPLAADDIYLGRDSRPRLNNLAALPDERTPGTQHDIRSLSRVIADCLPERTAATPGLRALLNRMLLDGASGYQSWGALLQAVRSLEPKIVPEDAFKLNAQEVAALEAVNAAKRRQRRALLLTTLGMFLLLWIVGMAAYFKFLRPPATKNFNKMLEVPAGEFIYQNGEKRTLPGFWIDEYEVTIGQYQQFLEALRKHPTTDYEAPNVPKGHRHDFDRWQGLYTAASTGGKYNGVHLDVNYPVVFLDWFDAYAYAKWKGHRLPTDEEWEKAARGTDGRRFPWGNDASQISKVNTSADYNEHDSQALGHVDGYNRWSPVDAMTGDRSPYGVMDMAGNVSEWTSTTQRRELVDYPFVRGGNFGSDTFDTTRRFNKLPDLQGADRVGFRTVTSTPPRGN